MSHTEEEMETFASKLEADSPTTDYFERTIQFRTNGHFLMLLIAQLELALRHSHNLGPSAGKARDFILSARKQMPPLLQAVVDAGFEEKPDFSPLKGI